MKDSVRRPEGVTAVEEAVQAARLDMIFGSQPMALLVSVVLAGIALGLLQNKVPALNLRGWFAAMAVVVAVRGGLCRRYRLERRQGTADLDTWERRFYLGAIIAGATWGSCALLIFPQDFTLQGFLAFLLAGVSSGAMAELAVAPRLARAFIIPCVVPLALRFFTEGDRLHTAMGTMTLLYAGLITFAMRRSQAQLRQTVAAQLDASTTRRTLTETTQRVEIMKSEFVSVVSHELRTPLTSIRGALGLLTHRDEELTEPARQLLQVASRNADRLHLLIEDLLDIEKIESGELRFELKCQPVPPLIQQSIADNSAFAMMHSVDLMMASDSAAVSMAVDARRFLQVMANLLTNAAKFSRAGSTVKVAVRSRDGRARIEVHDRGPGIPPAVQGRIFGKFCQGDSSDSRSQGGTGLGLAISKAIVEQMSGVIGFETEMGVGTTFYFELPVCEPPDGDA